MICLALLVFLAILFLLDWGSFRLRGDCDLALRHDEIARAYKASSGKSVLFSFDIPLENRSGKEQALVIFADAYLLPQKKEDKHSAGWTSVTLAESPRQDGYFEATLVKPHKKVPLRVRASLENFSPREVLEFYISYGYYGRTPMRTDRVKVSLSTAGFSENPQVFASPPEAPARAPRHSNVIPIPTHLILPGENLGSVISKYAGEKAKPGDWVAIAESVVAIAQGRVHPVETIKPGFWARRLNRFFQFNSSLASCYSMEMAIREAGLPRIMTASIVGLFGKVFGHSGDFYRVAGRSVAAIDDCTGTLPPFDKSVVMAPADPDETAEKIKAETGLEVAIVDANDLGKVDILGKSSGIQDEALVEALRDNPQGNADEQTPFVLIKR